MEGRQERQWRGGGEAVAGEAEERRWKGDGGAVERRWRVGGCARRVRSYAYGILVLQVLRSEMVPSRRAGQARCMT